MCKTPVKIVGPEQSTQWVACRNCRLCRDNRLNDLIGRCIAEQSTSSLTVAVTLTYGGGDSPEAAVLYYRHVQLMLKRLRKDGYSVRYICAGEYGTKKGRAHWHIILFFQGTPPDMYISQGKDDPNGRIDWKYWPHGYSYFQNTDYRGFRYVMKYALKAQDDHAAVKALTMSKKPPLGYEFFMNMAGDMVEGGLVLHSPEYSFASVLDRKGRARKYWLQGRMREMFLDEYYNRWFEKYGEEPPFSDWFFDAHQVPRLKNLAEASVIERMEAKAERMREKAVPREVALLPEPDAGLLCHHQDGTFELLIGEQSWLLFVNEKGKLRVRGGKPPKLGQKWFGILRWIKARM